MSSPANPSSTDDFPSLHLCGVWSTWIRARKVLLAGALSIGGSLLLIAGIAWLDESPIRLQSAESSTKDGGPVYNRIRWIAEKDRDVWLMQQSHRGPTSSHESWERLAIVVDKTSTPRKASYYQLEPGSMDFEPMMARAFRASCFTCHSNGPRAIRPVLDSETMSIGAWDRIRLALWNLRIKTYGRIEANPRHAREDTSLTVPFRHSQKFDNEELKLAACVKCHRDDGLFARGTLTRQNAQTIEFMVETGAMPPPGFTMSETDKRDIWEFVHGL